MVENSEFPSTKLKYDGKIMLPKRFYSKAVNVVFVRVKGSFDTFTTHAIYLTYCVGSSEECKQSTMLEF